MIGAIDGWCVKTADQKHQPTFGNLIFFFPELS
jgi:hypothetical protein